MSFSLDTPIAHLSRFGKLFAKRLQKLEITTVRDLLFYFPFRYDDLSTITPIRDLASELITTIRGRIELLNNRRSPRKRMMLTEALVNDDTGSVKVIWFNQPFLTKVLRVGDHVYLSGKVEEDLYGMTFRSPSYEKAGVHEPTHTARIVPVYSLTSSITEKQFRTIVKTALPFARHIPDWLPQKIQSTYALASLPSALQEIHFPTTGDALARARRRLQFDELFFIQLHAVRMRQSLATHTAPALQFYEEETKKFVASLPFTLTTDQRKSAWEILKDLEKPQPMNRLLEGDVGSGKTVVAAIAALNVLSNGFSVALMAPTEILAEQHAGTFTKLFSGWPFVIELMTGSKKQRNPGPQQRTEDPRKIRDKEAKKQTRFVIGTHALLQKTVHLKNLGLVIVDEQHRFGVGQRRILKEKGSGGNVSHLLSMTATPIPRTLALTLYGDLDLSLLREMPKGRKKIETTIVDPEERFAAYDVIRDEIAKGRQTFVICPLIDPSDALGVTSATQEAERLQKEIFPDLSVGLLHGRMKSKEKEHMMREFVENKIHILVSTAVVEVGVDVPNATIMMIEGAERFGLAQLHQFRGRVGRSHYQSRCFLFTESSGEKTRARLQAVVRSNDGFALAEEDLKLRGPGEIYGERQSGLPDLKIASLSDQVLIKQAREAAEQMLATDPTLENLPVLKARIEGWEEKLHLE